MAWWSFFAKAVLDYNGLYPTVATGADAMNEEGRGKGRLEAFVRAFPPPSLPSQGTEAALDVLYLPSPEEK